MSRALLIALVVFLLVAVWFDVRERRIPNRLVLTGLAAAFVLQVATPSAPGALAAGSGAALGLALLLPLYLLHAMGAGDVKLMAMVGAFVGPNDVLGALLFTFAAGGLLAVAVALHRRVFGRLLHNLRCMLYAGAARLSGGAPQVDAPPTAAQLPYAIAIAVGTVSFALWKQYAGSAS